LEISESWQREETTKKEFLVKKNSLPNEGSARERGDLGVKPGSETPLRKGLKKRLTRGSVREGGGITESITGRPWKDG